MRRKKSRPALDFSKYLCALLNRMKCRNIAEWKCEQPKINREAADVAGFDASNRLVVLLEIERLREDPASNVVKIWKWVKDRKIPSNIALIQAFSGPYSGSKKPRMERASFVGKEMQRRIPTLRYKQIPFKWNPRKKAKGIGGAAQGHARKLGRKIARFLNSS